MTAINARYQIDGFFAALRRHGLVEAVEHRSRPFGILSVRQGGGADEVREEHGCQLALDAGLRRHERMPA